MKKLYTIFALATALAVQVFAQTTNPPPLIPLPSYEILSFNSSNVVAHALLQSITNKSLALVPLSSGTNGWKILGSGVTFSNTTPPSVVAIDAGATGLLCYSNMTPISQNFRWRARIRTDSFGFQLGESLVIGFWTNGVPVDNGGLFGIMMGNGVGSGNQGFGTMHMTGITTGPATESWGTTKWTNNAYYDFCGFGDGTNIGWTVVYPGSSNEVWMLNAVSAFSPGVTLTNFGIEWFGTNGLLNSIGFRFGTNGQSGGVDVFNPKFSADNTSPFVQYSIGGAGGASGGVTVRIQVPANYDALTNVPDLLVNGHGNTGAARTSTYGGLDENGLPAVRDFHNYICSNANCIIVGVDYGNLDATGRKDSWGTSNSVYIIDAAINYVRSRWAFSNVFLWGESAGGASVINYAASHRKKIAGIIMNHAIYSASNSYGDGVNVTDQNFAYGGSTIAQLVTTTNSNGYLSGDAAGYGIGPITGVPFHIEYSFQETVTPAARHTDILGRLFGAAPPATNSSPVSLIYTNLPATPEFSYYGVPGGAGHGFKCYGLDVATNEVNFILRCRANANKPAVILIPGVTTYTTNFPWALTPPH